MAKANEREEVTVEKGFDLGTFFASYLESMEAAKEAQAKQINAAYDSLVSGANAQKGVIERNADRSFREIYANAKVSAQNQSEQLAALGLSRGASDASSSGYSETSRIRSDNAMQSNLSDAALARDGYLAQVDQQIGQINADRAKELSSMEQQYSGQLLGLMGTMMQTEFDYYTWQQESDYRREQDAYEREQDLYDRQQDALRLEYEKEQDAYRREQDALAQKNYEAEQAYKKQQDELEQQNWLKEYYLALSGRGSGSTGGSGGSDAGDGTKEAFERVQISEEELAARRSEEQFGRYLQFASSAASFPTAEAYAAYFDQLYRQSDITEAQYRRALRKRGISDKVATLRLGLL